MTHQGLSGTCWLHSALCLAAPPGSDPPSAQTILANTTTQNRPKVCHLDIPESCFFFLSCWGAHRFGKTCCQCSPLSTRDQCYCSASTHSWRWRELEGRKTGREWIREGSTFGTGLPQLPVLNEPGEHLRLHEDAEEAADAFRRHRLAESLPLKNAFPALVLSDEQGIVAHGLQEEADEGLGHQAVQGVVLCGHRRNRWMRKKTQAWTTEQVRSFLVRSFLNGFTLAKTDFDRNLADFSNKSGPSGQRILCVEAVRRPYWQNTTVSKSVNSKKKFCLSNLFELCCSESDYLDFRALRNLVTSAVQSWQTLFSWGLSEVAFHAGHKGSLWTYCCLPVSRRH